MEIKSFYCVKLFLLTTFLVLVGDIYASNNSTNKTDSIIIVYSNWHLLTDVPISAVDFPHVAKKKYVVRDKQRIKEFNDVANKLKKKKDSNPNIRCKLYFYEGKRVKDIIAISLGEKIHRNGYTFEFSEELYNMVNSEINSSTGLEFNRDDFETYSNEPITTNYKKIRKRLMSCLSEEYKNIPEGGDTIYAVCNSNTEGKTIDVKFYGLPKKNDCKTEKKCKAVLIKYLKWTKNPERSPMERYLFPIFIAK